MENMKNKDSQRIENICAPIEMEVLKVRDRKLEQLWAEFTDVPMDPETECMEEKFLHFAKGTHREVIWHWFDERYSKGVAHLLYGDGVDRTDEIAQLLYAKQLCFECESKDCAFNNDGSCKFPLVRGRVPKITDDDGCIEGMIEWTGRNFD